MTVRRIMGTEVEYGISVPGEPGVNPVISSTQVVLAYAASVAAPRARRPRWDYEVESPLRDARGYDLSTLFGAAEPDVDDIGAANVILSNGSRLYVDHAHPEFSAPEVTNPLDAVLFDKAGERVMEAAARLAASLPGSKPIQMYKNNVDGKGASYGTHENYLCSRDTPFPAIISGLTPFFSTRQVFAGAGRVGIGPAGQTEGFQLAQRSDYIEVEVGLETTLKRGIINTRDEPHADADKHRRPGAVHDRIRLGVAVGGTGPPGRRGAPDLARPDAEGHGSADRRAAAHRPGRPARVPRGGGQVRRGRVRLGRRRADA